MFTPVCSNSAVLCTTCVGQPNQSVILLSTDNFFRTEISWSILMWRFMNKVLRNLWFCIFVKRWLDLSTSFAQNDALKNFPHNVVVITVPHCYLLRIITDNRGALAGDVGTKSKDKDLKCFASCLFVRHIKTYMIEEYFLYNVVVCSAQEAGLLNNPEVLLLVHQSQGILDVQACKPDKKVN